MLHIALPVKEGYLSDSFEASVSFHIFHILKNKWTEEVKIMNHAMNIKTFEKWCADNQITDVIVSRISKEFIKVLNKNKINVYPGVEIKPPLELVNELIEGSLMTKSSVLER